MTNRDLLATFTISQFLFSLIFHTKILKHCFIIIFLNEIDNLCWNEHGTIAAVSLDKEQAPSAGHKTPPTDKTRIRGKNPSGRVNEKYDFNPLETAWKQVGDAKRKTNQYITIPNSAKILRTKRPPQG